MAPVSLPVLAVGLATCVLVEKLRWFGYGTSLPANVRQVLADYDREQAAKRTPREVAMLIAQAFAAVILSSRSVCTSRRSESSACS
jgi:NhaB family Na+:H+ antiporter